MLLTNDNYFIDSNICLYLISEDLYKNFLHQYTSTIRKYQCTYQKFKQLSIDDINKHIDLLVKYNSVATIQSSDIKNAIQIKAKYQLQWYDSLIIATALQAQCKILYTEDMQHNLVVNNTLTIINPFVN